jgi:cytochrome c biogenesis protein CcdA
VAVVAAMILAVPASLPAQAGGAQVCPAAPVTGAPPSPETSGTLAFTLMVLGAGLLDGINPCALSVLLFFVAYLFTLQGGRPKLLTFGFVYIGTIYLTYLAIGVGLLNAFSLGVPQLFTKLGAGLMIGLGLVNIKDYFWFGVGPSLSISQSGAAMHNRWMRRGTLPATAVAGFLVALFEFPCTGAIYVGILALLAAHTTFASGLGYLLAYNLMFVLPLIATLLLVGNRRTLGQFSRWMAANKRQFRLGQGTVMIGLGAIIFLWFV